VRKPDPPVPQPQPVIQPIQTRQPTPGELACKRGLLFAKLYHTYSAAQVVGVYPA
jgi:hypothetical protein